MYHVCSMQAYAEVDPVAGDRLVPHSDRLLAALESGQPRHRLFVIEPVDGVLGGFF